MRLTDYLANRDETDASFAEQIGVTPQALSRYKLGQRKPQWPILDKIRRVTEGAVTPNDFLDVFAEPGGPPSDLPGAFRPPTEGSTMRATKAYEAPSRLRLPVPGCGDQADEADEA